MTNSEKEKIQKMREQGIGYSKIANELSISVNTVRSFCRRIKISNMPTIKCKECGCNIKIVPKQKPKIFCSDKCRVAWWTKNHDEINKKAWYEFVCAGCGKNFRAYGNNHRKYCSHSCYIYNRYYKDGDIDD